MEQRNNNQGLQDWNGHWSQGSTGVWHERSQRHQHNYNNNNLNSSNVARRCSGDNQYGNQRSEGHYHQRNQHDQLHYNNMDNRDIPPSNVARMGRGVIQDGFHRTAGYSHQRDQHNDRHNGHQYAGYHRQGDHPYDNQRDMVRYNVAIRGRGGYEGDQHNNRIWDSQSDYDGAQWRDSSNKRLKIDRQDRNGTPHIRPARYGDSHIPTVSTRTKPLTQKQRNQRNHRKKK